MMIPWKGGNWNMDVARVGILFVMMTSGCALLGKSEALSPRYFSPDTSLAAPAQPSAQRGRADSEMDQAFQLRLGRITAAPYLGERIVYRESNYELGFYEERRWTEKPGVYLQRALSQALFEVRGVRRIVSGPGPTLEVELTEFAAFKQEPPLALVRATYILYDHRLVRREATVTVEVPIEKAHSTDSSSGEAADAEVRAMTKALNELVQRIVNEVLAELPAHASSPEAAPPAGEVTELEPPHDVIE